MKKVLFIAWLFVSLNVSAEINAPPWSLQDYLNTPRDDDEIKWRARLLYIRGLIDGFKFANVTLAQVGSSRLYCPSGKLALTADNTVQILDDWLETYQPKDPNLIRREGMFGNFVLEALKNAFPCTE